MPEEIEQGVKDTAEEPVAEPPPAEDTPTEPVAPAAEVTGVQQPEEPGEPETPGPVPYERFKEVNERAKLAQDYEQRLKAYEQVLSDPAVRQVALEALRRGEPQTPTVARPEPISEEVLQQNLPDGWTVADLSEIERSLLERTIRAESMATRADQQLGQTTAERAFGEYNTKVDELTKAAGIQLTEAERGELNGMASIVNTGASQSGRPMSPSQVAVVAFKAVLGETIGDRKAAAARATEIEAQKVRIAAGRTGRGSPSGEPNPTFGTPEEAAEAAWEQTKHLFEAEGRV